jgi:hypothetical protein
MLINHRSVIRGLDPRIHPLRNGTDCRVKPGNDALRQPLLIALMLVLASAGVAPAQDGRSSPLTAVVCPKVNFTGFSVGSEKVRIPERMWWDADKQSYFIQGPELARRFIYPDAKRPLSELKSDSAHVYQIPLNKKVELVNQDVCRPRVEISAECQMAPVPGAPAQPALVFSAEYYDECEQQPTHVVIRIEKLSVGTRTGIQFSFYNAFRNIYDSGMDVLEGENVFNMGYRLK